MYHPKKMPDWTKNRRPVFHCVVEFQDLVSGLEAVNNSWEEKKNRKEIPRDRSWKIIKILFEDYLLFVAIDPIFGASYVDVVIAKIKYVNIDDGYADNVDSVPEFVPENNPQPSSTNLQ